MAVNREYRCTFHEEEFESTEEHPSCPFGCGPQFVVMEFRTPVSIRHRGTSINDMLTRTLADDYNMTDVKGDKEGTSVMSNTSIRSGGARIIGDKGKAYWNADLFPVQGGWAQRQEAAPVFKPPPSMQCAATPIASIQQGAQSYLKKATVMLKPPKS
jgi:hypothetical protein